MISTFSFKSIGIGGFGLTHELKGIPVSINIRLTLTLRNMCALSSTMNMMNQICFFLLSAL